MSRQANRFLIERRLLLDANAEVANGDWFRASDLEAATVHIFGLDTGDTVQLWGSNEVGTPANAVQIGNDIDDNDAIVELSNPPAQIQARRTADAGEGTVTAILSGRLKGA